MSYCTKLVKFLEVLEMKSLYGFKENGEICTNTRQAKCSIIKLDLRDIAFLCQVSPPKALIVQY